MRAVDHRNLGLVDEGLGQSVGVDEYVSKFEPERLAEALTRRLLAVRPGGRNGE